VLAIDSVHHPVQLICESAAQPRGMTRRENAAYCGPLQASASCTLQQTDATDLLRNLTCATAEIAVDRACHCVELEKEMVAQPLMARNGGGGAEHEASSDDLSAGVAP
jgi:hypothetical protein